MVKSIAVVVPCIIVLAVLLYRRRARRPKAAEHYGPPPGRARALSHTELGDRGWAEGPREYEANSASSISALMLRSA